MILFRLFLTSNFPLHIFKKIQNNVPELAPPYTHVHMCREDDYHGENEEENLRLAPPGGYGLFPEPDTRLGIALKWERIPGEFLNRRVQLEKQV